MAARSSSGRMEFEFTSRKGGGAGGGAGGDSGGGGAGGGEKFRILVLGDFSGRESRGVVDANVAARKAVAVDVDNLERVIAACGVEVHLPVGDAGGRRLPVAIKGLGDFHPDRLFERLPIFPALAQLHARLRDPATFAAAAAEVQALLGSAVAAAAPAPVAAPAAAQGGNPFASLLGQAQSDAPAKPTAAEAFIRETVQSYMVAKADPQQASLLKLVEAALGAGMRAILHQPAFQAAEAAWRGVHFLVSNLTTDENLKIFVMDVSKAELAADLAVPELEKSGMYKLLVEQAVQTQGGEPWALVVGQYTFEGGMEDVKTLARMATVAAAARAPFVAGAAAAIVGCPSFAAAPDPDNWRAAVDLAVWNKLRELDQARYLALTAPRFLLRQPYGAASDQTEKYHFEELTAPPHHEDYLWGHGGLAVAYLLGTGFLEDGWAYSPGEWLEVGDLPAHLFEQDGTRTMKACAEAYLSDRAAEKILEFGITPVLSVKGRNAVRVVGISSVAKPQQALKGRWG